MDFYTRYCCIRVVYHDMAYSSPRSRRNVYALYIMVKSERILSKDASEQLKKRSLVTKRSVVRETWFFRKQGMVCLLHSASRNVF